MNTSILQEFHYHGIPIQVLGSNEQPLFIAQEICEAIDLSDTRKAVSRLDDDEKLMGKVFRSGQDREMWLINEPGLYNLVLRSTKPEAKAFKRWVTHEVLPSIRKTGQYRLDRQPTRMELAKMVLEAEQELDQARPRLKAYERLHHTENVHSMRKAAQVLGTGRTRLFQLVREHGIFPEGQTTPYQKYIERGYFKVKVRTYNTGEQEFSHATAFVTGKGLTWLARRIFGQQALTTSHHQFQSSDRG